MTGRSLADSFRRLIAATGPISVAQFMGESNARYYANRDPLGAEGDFITAPEISQMFGELIGLWLADGWIRAGRVEPALYVELGPGRGTLARDALRAMKRYGLEPEVQPGRRLTELKRLQLEAIPEAQFHADLSTVPFDGPMLLAANEFLDALPVRQLIMTPEGWREVMLATDDAGGFVCVAGRQPMDAAVPEARRKAEVGTRDRDLPRRRGHGVRSRRAARRPGRRGTVHRLRLRQPPDRLDAAGGREARQGRPVSPHPARPT
jgi:NADH dehydrogenase [ubiquinone] 1 alpha subcomplex assembly factor 7